MLFQRIGQPGSGAVVLRAGPIGDFADLNGRLAPEGCSGGVGDALSSASLSVSLNAPGELVVLGYLCEFGINGRAPNSVAGGL